MSKKQSKKRRYKQSPDKLIKGLLGLAIIWLLGSVFFMAVVNMMTKTVIIGSEIREEVYSTYGFVGARSYVINSPLTGEGTAIAPEGFRVRKNEAVFSVLGAAGSAMQSQQEKVMYTPVSGVVSYKVDGFEDYHTIEQVATLDLKAMHDNPPIAKVSTPQEGLPYAKIVNNLVDIHVFVPCEVTSQTQELEVDDTIKIRFPEIDLETVGRIVDSNKVVQMGDETAPDVLDDGITDALASEATEPKTEELELLPEEPSTMEPEVKDPQKEAKQIFYLEIDLGDVRQVVLGQRVFQVELLRNAKSVISIPKNAVVYKGDEPGVYCLKKGFVLWQGIEIKETLDKEVIVAHLSEGTEVITTPKLVSEGKKVKSKGNGK